MQNTEEHIEETPSESEGLIKTPRQLIITILLAFIIPIAVIVMLVKLVAVTSPMGAGSRAQTEEAIAQRLQPVAGFKLVDADAPTEIKTGEQVYESTCAACHTTGVAGAPKVGDNAAWAPLIETGFDEMLKIAINGVGAMPARGGNPSLSDLEVARAVTLMANQSGGSFDEPSEEGAADEAAAKSDDTAAQETTPAESAEPQPAAAETEPASATVTATEDQATQTSEATTEATTDTAEQPAAAQEQTAEAEAAPESEQKQTAAVATELDPAGEKLYKSICFACHTTGVANAPKLGDKASWAPYIETGFETMLEKSIQGVGAMPPRGGSQASDDEMKAALEYMLSTLQ